MPTVHEIVVDLLRDLGDRRRLDRARRYVEKVGDDGFLRASVGAGPYRVVELAFLWGVGPRVEEACVDHIKGFSYSAPYEDLKLKPSR
jgi:hypothetical protein